MAEKESRRVKTLSGFMKWAAQFNDGRYLFRGVSKDCYKIEPSTYRRLASEADKNPTQLLKINKQLIEDARSRGHDQRNGQPLSDLELLAELQHFGAATCLIDFSRNALVALWFACQQSSKGEANGKVFAVRHDDFLRLKTVTPKLIKKTIDSFFKLDENDNYLIYQWEPKYQNNRIIAQQSVFLFSGAQIEAKAECVILKNSKRDLLSFLDQFSGITEASIYPDFDGFASLHAHHKPYIEPDVRGYLQRGFDALQNNNLDAAIQHYNTAIELSPYHTEAYIDRGVLYRFKGDEARADEDEGRAIEYYDRAIEDFNQVMQLNPNHAMAYTHRGVAYLRKGEFDRAVTDSQQAIRLDPDNPQAYYTIDTVQSHQGE